MGLLGGLFGSSDKGAKKAAKLAAANAAKWEKLELPTKEDLLLDLPRFFLDSPDLSPELINTYTQAQSDLASFKVDPALRNVQASAATEMMKVANNPNLSMIDKAQM